MSKGELNLQVLIHIHIFTYKLGGFRKIYLTKTTAEIKPKLTYIQVIDNFTQNKKRKHSRACNKLCKTFGTAVSTHPRLYFNSDSDLEPFAVTPIVKTSQVFRINFACNPKLYANPFKDTSRRN